MPVFYSKFPTEGKLLLRITLADLISVLPPIIPYPLNIWVSDRMARDGVVSGNLIFVAEMDEEPTHEHMGYFNSLVKPLGIAATLSNDWRKNKKQIAPIRLYNHGRLILSKDLRYLEPPSPITLPLELTADYFLSRLPRTVPFVDPIHATGSIVTQLWSANDVDLLVGELDENGQTLNYEKYQKPRLEVKKYFTELLQCKVDVGVSVMLQRETLDSPVAVCTIYRDGNLCLV